MIRRRLRLAIVMAWRALRGQTIELEVGYVGGEHHFIAIER